MTYTPLPEFKIENFIDRLIPVEGEKNRYQCPNCKNKNLTIKPGGGWRCWNGCASSEIMEAIRPFKEAIAQARQQQNGTVQLTKEKPFRSRTKLDTKSAVIPSGGVTLARLSELPTDAPQPQKRSHPKHGEVLAWRFYYSDFQWIERIQWVDLTKEKGYDKDYFPFFIAKGGEQVPVRRDGKTVEYREVQAGEVICGKGQIDWTAYRLEESIEAAKASGANALILAEGEPCVETYRSMNIAAFTFPGAGWSKNEITTAVKQVQAAGLIIIGHPDHDQTGYEKAKKVATVCAAVGVPYLQLDPVALDPEIQEHGDVANILAKLGSDEYQQQLESEIQRQVKQRQQLDDGDSHPLNGDGDGNDGNSGSNSDEFAGFSANEWKAPDSWQSEIGFWVKDKETDEVFFRPFCNFDFQIIRELTSEDGGGIEITLKRSFNSQEKHIFIESVAYTNTEKFVDAVKKALGSGVVCTLNKSDLSALIHTRLRDYHQRGGKTYKLVERRGRQDDGTWVFENCQFKPDGTLTNTQESGWVYAEVFPNCEDVIPSPVIADYDPIILRRYLEVKRRAFGRNFEPSVLLDGWVVAGLFDTEIVAKERSFPLINPYGDPGGFKSFAAESSLSLVGFPNAETMLSKVSESALFEWLKRLGSLPVILDDPKREAGGIDIEEVAKRAFNRFARVVRGNRQEPHGGLAITSNHLIGEKNSATRSRLIPLFFPVLGEDSYEKSAFSELLTIRETVSGCFPDLLKLGYNTQAIKILEEEFRHHLPAAHARTAKSLAISTHYAVEVVRMAGLEDEIDIKKWVIQVLCPLCNESQAGLSSVADFAEHLDVLESRALVGEWCKIEVHTDKYGLCVAMHLPTVWKEFDREFSPTYNRSVLEQVLTERGAIKNQVAKFWADREQTLAYKRQIIVAGIDGYSPKPPEKVSRKCLLIPQNIWEILFKGHSEAKPTPPTLSPISNPVSYQPVTSVTSSYQEQVTSSKVTIASHTTMQSDVSYLVTFKEEDQDLNNCHPPEGASERSNFCIESPHTEVTEVTAPFEVIEAPTAPVVQPVTCDELLQVTKTGKKVTELSPYTIQQMLQVMTAINSAEAFKRFHDLYQQYAEIQQQQVLEAFTTMVDQKSQAQFYKWQRSFEAEYQRIGDGLLAEQTNAAQLELENCLMVHDYRRIVQKYGQSIVNTASKRLSGRSKNNVDRIVSFIQKKRLQ
jgi:hypothetical protein